MNKFGFLLVISMLMAVAQPVMAQNYNRNGQYVGSPSAATPYNPYSQPVYNPYSGRYQPPLGTGYFVPGGGNYTNPYANQGGGANYNYPYANQGGYGYYAPNPYATGYPAFGTPVPLNGGYVRFNVGGFNGSYWKSPSGYYYPWGAGGVYSSPPPIIMVQQGESQPVQPPVGDMIKDMNSYIEEKNKNSKFKTDDYQHLARRLRDIQNLESSMRSRNNGSLEAQDEETIRKDLAMLSGDISRRVIP